MLGHAGELAIPKTETQTTVANDTLITIAASTTGEQWCLDWVTVSIDVSTATQELLTITDGGGLTIFNCSLPIATDAGYGVRHFTFPHGIWSGVNAGLVITMSALGAGETAILSAGWR
jgi:hypothetical protein